MKTNDLKALHDKTVDELQLEAAKLKAEFVKAKIEHSVVKLANTDSLKTLRKDIAKVKTKIKQKELKAGRYYKVISHH